MKKFLTGIAALAILVGCTGRQAEQTQEDSMQRAIDSIAREEALQQAAQARLDSIRQDSIRQDSIELAHFTDEVRQLWKGVPDHGINGRTKSSLSKNFYNLVDVGFAVPSDCPYGIGEEEFMYIWYTGTDTGNNDGIVSIKIVSHSPDLRVVNVVYKTFDRKETHKLKFIKETAIDKDGNEQQTWVIDDFDGMKKKIYDYINTTGKKFLNGYANEILDDPENDFMNSRERQEYLDLVEQFRKKFYKVYPKGVVKK